MQRIKTLLILVIAVAAAAWIYALLRPKHPVQENAPLPEEHPVEAPAFNAFGSIPVRFDGYYMERVDQLCYLVRFFPEGRAVLVNGTEDLLPQLPSVLVRDAKGDPVIGHYNVPVTIKGDSMFFTTRPEKGTIDYSGIAVNADQVRFLRHSHINGARHIKVYDFQPDALQQ